MSERSYSIEQELRELADKLNNESCAIRDAADAIERLRETSNYEDEIAKAKKQLKEFTK